MKINKVQEVLIITLILNLLVAGGKIFYGYQLDLISMMSDGFHSLMDSTSNIVGLFAMYISQKPPDKNYQYGYKKFEAFASIVISLLLFLTTYEVIKNLLERFFYNSKPIANFESILVMVITIFINIFVSKYESAQGRKLKSKFLIDDASHTTSDIFVSLSVLASIIAIKYGFVFFDFIASSVIVFIIASLAWKILVESVNVLSDYSAVNISDIERYVMNVDGVKSFHKIRTRGMMDNIFIDLHIQVDPDLTITEAHKIGHEVQSILKNEIDGVREVITHVEPSKNV